MLRSLALLATFAVAAADLSQVGHVKGQFELLGSLCFPGTTGAAVNLKLDAAVSGDGMTLAEQAHRLKGESSGLGLNRVTTMATALERDAIHLDVADRRLRVTAIVAALGDTLEAVIATLAGLDLLKQYRRLRTYGCSGGGYPAVLAGHRLGAELAISVAGRFPGRNYWSRLRWTLQARPPAGAHSSCTALLAYSRKHGRDRKFARFLRWGAAARRLPIAMPGHDSEHNIF